MSSQRHRVVTASSLRHRDGKPLSRTVMASLGDPVKVRYSMHPERNRKRTARRVNKAKKKAEEAAKAEAEARRASKAEKDLHFEVAVFVSENEDVLTAKTLAQLPNDVKPVALSE